MRLKSSYMYDLPIPVPSKTETEAVVNIVEQCLAFGGEESQLKALESQLNDRVAWLYGLSEIESSVYEGDKQVEL